MEGAREGEQGGREGREGGRGGKEGGREGRRDLPIAMATNIRKVVESGFSKGLVRPSSPTDVI